jgi:hypothetical protein
MVGLGLSELLVLLQNLDASQSNDHRVHEWLLDDADRVDYLDICEAVRHRRDGTASTRLLSNHDGRPHPVMRYTGSV